MYQEVEIWQDFLSVFLVFQVSWISASWLAHLDSWWLYLHGRYALPIHIQRTKVIYIRFALILQIYQGEAYVFVVWMIFESGCGIQMSQATPTKFSMLFKHTYGNFVGVAWLIWMQHPLSKIVQIHMVHPVYASYILGSMYAIYVISVYVCVVCCQLTCMVVHGTNE